MFKSNIFMFFYYSIKCIGCGWITIWWVVGELLYDEFSKFDMFMNEVIWCLNNE
jgi:hypothetical protein